MNWRWVSIAASLAALAAGYHAFIRPDATAVAPAQAPQQPSYFLTDAIITQTQPDGAPSFRLTAQRIDQEPKDQSIRLTDVRVDYLKAPEREWVLTAQQGFVPEGSRVIQFSGDVHLRPIDSTTPTYLRTNALAIDTERNLAYTTTSPAQIRVGRFSMTVKRLEADLETEKLKLEAARGRAEPG